MSHDDGVRWLRDQLLEVILPRRELVAARYLETDSALEEEYCRGEREALDDVLNALDRLVK